MSNPIEGMFVDAIVRQTFERIFNPRKVAVVGVSAQGFGFGRGIFLSLLRNGFGGELYPVNPSGGEANGKTVYRSAEEIPGDIDFAIVAVPAKFVPEVLKSCRAKGAAGAEVLSAGFKETGTPTGIELEEEIADLATKDFRIIGPNCFGVYSPAAGLTMLPGPDLSRKVGPVAFVSQSGGHAIDFALAGKGRGIYFSKVVSFGNGADLRETELLQYLDEDPQTRMVAMYLEGLQDGRAFIQVLKQVTKRKPVIILKGGWSKAGQRAAASHTGSLGGDRLIWEGALGQAGAILVQDLEELMDCCLAFSHLPQKTFAKVSVIGGGGALGVAAADWAEEAGLHLPEIRTDLQDKILPLLPQPGSCAKNPIDVANPFVAPEVLGEVLRVAAQDDQIELQVLVGLLYHYHSLALILGAESIKGLVPFQELALQIKTVVDQSQKPVVAVFPNHKQEPEALDIEEMIRAARSCFLELGIPVFDRLRGALHAIAKVSQYYLRRHATDRR